MNVRCQCGRVTFRTPLPKPLKMYICHCLECQHQSSSAFGGSSIFPRFALPPALEPLLGYYTRPTDRGKSLDCYFCKNCGSRLVHSMKDEETTTVKSGAIEGLDWTGAVHIWTKRAVVAIPEGVESWPGEPDEGGSETGKQIVGKDDGDGKK